MGSVNIQRAVGQLARTEPTEDAVVCMVLSGVAVAGKIALSEAKRIYDTEALVTLGIDDATNPLAYKEIKEFYAAGGEGQELNIMLVSDATSLTDICDLQNNILKKLLDSVGGRGVIVVANKVYPDAYVPTITDGLYADVNGAVTKLNAMAEAYQLANTPFVAALPAFGLEDITDVPARSTLENDYVALNTWCSEDDGIVSMGQLAGWIAKHQVHQNIGRVASGKVADTAFMPDGSTADSHKSEWAAYASKGLLTPIKIAGKSGYFFQDDPTLTKLSSDYSSISWNRVINKAQRIAFSVLVEKLNDDVDTDITTGQIEGSLISDWESDVENAIRAQMQVLSSTKKKEISGVQCSINPDSDIVNDEVDATLTIVRKGQAKQINVQIRYAETV